MCGGVGVGVGVGVCAMTPSLGFWCVHMYLFAYSVYRRQLENLWENMTLETSARYSDYVMWLK